jgi:TPR repeat protein
MLVKRGNDFLGNGDLAAARLLFRRAAEGGSAEGALALGATFDPVVMQRLGAVGTAPDVTLARQWYQRAIELGSATASQRLAGLQASR